MKHPFTARVPSFDAAAVTDTIQRALASAGLDTKTGPMHEVTETIRRALAAGGLGPATPPPDRESAIDVEAHVVSTGEDAPAQRRAEPSIRASQPGPGRFTAHAFRNEAGARTYKLHVPPGGADAPRAMVVMLHGCTQSADDFAAGTRMNELADAHGCLVGYPEQASQANASRCWNWFEPANQARGAGEPALIAGIVREVAQRHGADPRRIFVAGLSAGAAMAVVLGETYPDLFAGVGAHSGLPFASAHDITSAMAAMKGGRSGRPGAPGLRAAAATSRKASGAIPVIVFHGDRDHTVQPSNGARIVQQAEEAYAALPADVSLRASTQEGMAQGGRRYTRTIHATCDGQPRVEHWTVHGAGHAWSGGHPGGTFTDGAGPDASAEMVRFFLALPCTGTPDTPV